MSEYKVYDDDVALGQKAPSLASLIFHNGEGFEVGTGKVTVVTWMSKLNKSDFSTLSKLSEIYNNVKEHCNFVAISRDAEEVDCTKWLTKFNNKFFAELQGPGGAAGVQVTLNFPIAYDKGGETNAAFKAVMKKAVVGVGLTIIIDQQGAIKWYEVFQRGDNPMNQFEPQLANIIQGKPLISNGNAPVEEEEEEEMGGGGAMDDPDLFGGGGGDGY